MDVFYQQLRLYNASYQGISAAMKLVFPRGKTTIYDAFMESVEKTYIPPVEDILIVHYDEQHPKTSRRQKFRLTLLDRIISILYFKEPANTLKIGSTLLVAICVAGLGLSDLIR